MGTSAIRHFFPGGNTPRGFFSYYNYIISHDANRIFVLKGGPGTGKSTFMRKIGEALLSRGYDVEYHHCSSDNNSLDGVVIPKLGIALIDGTAPHIVDPQNPGCIDEILHLGDYWDAKGIAAHRTAIRSCNMEISKCYQRGYRMLKAAKLIYDDLAAVYTEVLNIEKANKAADELIEGIFDNQIKTGSGKTRKLFASAITPDGPVNFLASTVWNVGKCYVVSGSPGTGKSTILQKIINTAISKGLDIEIFYCPLDPDKPEHVVIPALNTAVTTSIFPHLFNFDEIAPVAVLNMNDCLNVNIVDKHTDMINYDQHLFRELWEKTIECINKSKQLHDQLETYYIPHMNFQGIQRLWEKTLARILAYEINT